MTKIYADTVWMTASIPYPYDDIAMIVALLFALGGSVFVAIYFLRRRKK